MKKWRGQGVFPIHSEVCFRCLPRVALAEPGPFWGGPQTGLRARPAGDHNPQAEQPASAKFRESDTLAASENKPLSLLGMTKEREIGRVKSGASSPVKPDLAEPRPTGWGIQSMGGASEKAVAGHSPQRTCSGLAGERKPVFTRSNVKRMGKTSRSLGKFLVVFWLMGMAAPAPVSAKNLIPLLAREGLPRWEPPRVEQVRLENGFRLYTLKDSSLPLLEVSLYLQTGEAHVSHKKSGLANLFADGMTTGGTQVKTPEELDEWLDQRAIHLGAEAGRELTLFNISSLSTQIEETLEIFREVLFTPRFDPGRFDLAKQRTIENLHRLQDQPNSVLERAFRTTLYGKKHPWGHVPTPRSVRKIKREEIVRFYHDTFHPGRMALIVVGDFSPAKIRKWAEETFGRLPPRDEKFPDWSVLPLEAKAKKKKIKMKVNQVFLEAGHLGLKRHQEEKYAYSLLQYILGGDTFTSRLGADIRTTRGLAYSVYTDWEAVPPRGHFSIHVETKQASGPEVLGAIRSHLARLHEQQDITAEELKGAREALLNRYIFWFESPFELAVTKAKLDLLGFSPDYLETYPEKMKGVTLEAIKKTAAEYVLPHQLTVVTVEP